MKKIFYIICFSFLGVLVGFLAHALIEWPLIFLLAQNFERYSLGFSWSQWFVIHNVGTVLLLFAGGLFGLSQGFLWWRILYVEKRRFSHHHQAIVLDFDHVLFNHSLYLKALAEVFTKEFEISPSIFLQHYNAAKSCCEVADWRKFINSLPHPNQQAMQAAQHQLIEDRAAEFVFSDARYFIEHHKNRFDIILLTHGDKDLQAEKIKFSNLPKVTKVTITQKSKTDSLVELLEDYQKVYFIDDRVAVINKVEKIAPELVSYLLERPEWHLYGQADLTDNASDRRVSGLNFEIES